MSKKALITGITGQDGSYLAELLLEKGYEVHGIRRRISSINTKHIDPIYEKQEIKEKKLFLHYGDLTDSLSMLNVMEEVKPDEVYNLAAQSHVHVSFKQPVYTGDVDALGATRLLESIRILGLMDKTKFYQASTSELYGLVQEIPQKESTPFYPRSPYAVAKLYAYWMTVNYREAYGLFGCNGILFNHESPRRGETFVTRKITRGLSRIACGLDNILELGNLNALRDWGHAKDYVLMQWLMLQQDKPTDFVISTGKQYTVREFVKWSADALGIDLEFSGEGVDEIGVIAGLKSTYNNNLKVGQVLVRVNKQYFRPAEVETLLGDSSLANNLLNWEPLISVSDMCKEMVNSDFRQASAEALLLDHVNKSGNPYDI